MAVETVDNGVAPNGDTFPNPSVTASSKKLRESERRRRRRKQKKNKKESEVDVEEGNVTGASVSKENDDPQKQVTEEVVFEYVPEQPEFEEGFEDAFRKIFDKFNFRESVASEVQHGKKEEPQYKADVENKLNSDSDSEAEEHNNQAKENGISNKKKKLQRRMNIAELKQVSARPDVVEGKRGIEKQPFHLPDFIAGTGIEKIRQAYIEKEDGKKLKQKQRERMQPKMGKMNIDYQVLHDAFFKYQTKPKLTSLGELYFEGKEFEVKLREMKPGTLSHDLKEALGMSEGAPPPWLINMQRYGPPPSYPHLKIPGLNAPIPLGASFGFHASGWGNLQWTKLGVPCMVMSLVFSSKISLPMRMSLLTRANTGVIWRKRKKKKRRKRKKKKRWMKKAWKMVLNLWIHCQALLLASKHLTQ